jgi:hypothetical protein
VRIAHPSGVMEIEAAAHEENGRPVVDRATNGRTVRPIMRGELYLRRAEIQRLAEAIPVDDPARRVPEPGSSTKSVSAAA